MNTFKYERKLQDTLADVYFVYRLVQDLSFVTNEINAYGLKMH